jgi:hypothetical protein
LGSFNEDLVKDHDINAHFGGVKAPPTIFVLLPTVQISIDQEKKRKTQDKNILLSSAILNY